MIEKIYNISDQGIICDFGKEINKEININMSNTYVNSLEVNKQYLRFKTAEEIYFSK